VTRDGGVLQAQTQIASTPHHVTLVQVEDVDSPGGLTQVAVDDPDDHLANFRGADPGADGPFYTVEVPEHPGEWALLLSPFCR
jgi:hypothetical protein